MSDIVDRLGPYSLPQLDEICDHIREAIPHFTPPLIVRALEAASSPAAWEAVCNGRSVILLWRETPSWGHFITLVPRTLPSGRVSLELFDPLGGGDDAREASRYLGGDNPALNGENRWIAQLFDRWTSCGGEASYNTAGPQSSSENSCGAWCILRTLNPQLSPSAFTRQFRPR